MITQQLLDYIKQQLGQGISKEQIKSILLEQGWAENDIEDGFRKVEENQINPSTNRDSQKQKQSFNLSDNSNQESGKAGPQILQNNHNKNIFWIIGALILIGIIILGGYWYYLKLNRSKNPSSESTNGLVKEALAKPFAQWTDFPVKVNPQVPDYKIAPDWSNVVNYSAFTLSPEAKKQLENQYFFIQDSNWKHFWPVYEENRYNKVPNFITTDSILHTYHVYFDSLLSQVEGKKLTALLKDFTNQMSLDSQKQYQELKGTKWENAAKRNIAFFSVVNKLINPDSEIPTIVQDRVNKELKLIKDHQGINVSPVMSSNEKPGAIVSTPQGNLPISLYKEDYSQYVPRGHYTRTEELKRYFKTMMYLGRMNFRLKVPDETKSAVLITLAINNKKNLQDEWDKIYQPTVFFVGKSDDLNFYDYSSILGKIYGFNFKLSDLLSNQNKLNQFLQEAKSLKNPQINSMPIFEAGLQPDRNKEIKGFRVMGQRFTIDASIFQRLLYREIGDKSTNCANFNPDKTSCLSGARCLPKGLDIPAAMGSKKALNILDQQGETKYACYSENMGKMKKYISGLNKPTWTQNLYWGWLYSLKPLLTENFGNGYPMFMRNDSWVKKSLNSYLSSWTELKHDTILYAKQAYAELGGGGGSTCCKPVGDDRGYVEPYSKLYSQLASLTKITKDGLSERGLISDHQTKVLNLLVELCQKLQNISQKELNNQPLSKDDYELIRAYGGSLEHFWTMAMRERYCYTMGNQEEIDRCLNEVRKENKEKVPQLEKWSKDYKNSFPLQFLDKEQAALIADVATDPNGSALEEATGPLFNIYVVIPTPREPNHLKIAKGVIFSHYEFTHPMSDRLTDEKWHQMIDQGKTPSLPQWFKPLVNNKKSANWIGQWVKMTPEEIKKIYENPKDCANVKCNHCPPGYTSWGEMGCQREYK